MKTQLTKLEIKEKTVQYEGKSAKCYILSKDILRQKFRDLLRDPNFDFAKEEVEEE